MKCLLICIHVLYMQKYCMCIILHTDKTDFTKVQVTVQFTEPNLPKCTFWKTIQNYQWAK